jgi:prophage regulatory protein
MKLLGIDELRTVKGINYSRAHLYRLIKIGKFVKPIHLGTGRIAFVETEIDAWIKERVAERDAAA